MNENQPSPKQSVHRLTRYLFAGAAPVLVLLFFFPFSVSAQKLPQASGKKTAAPGISTLPNLLATDAGIETELSRIKAHVQRLRAEGTITAEELAAPADTLSPERDPRETSSRNRIASELAIDLDRQIDALNELKEIRKDNASYELERRSWKGFTEKPPFPIAFLDDIRDALLSNRLALESAELRLSLARASFRRFDKAIESSRKALRLAEEASDRSAGTPQETKNRRLLDLARLQNDRNEAGLLLSELQRIAYETAVQGKRAHVAFLEEKLRTAEASSPLSKEDLEKKLADLNRQRRDLEAELLAAQKSEADGTKKLDEIRAALASLPVSVGEQSPGALRKLLGMHAQKDDRKASRPEHVQSLKQDLDAQQAFVETARYRVAVLKARIQLVNAAEKIWNERFWLNEKHDLKAVREKQEEAAETLMRLEIVKKWADSSLSSWMNLIKSQKERLAPADRSSLAARTSVLLLSTYEERQSTTLRFIEGLGQLERLANRLKDELDRRIKTASFSGRMKEQLQNAYSFLLLIWNFELYVATETIVVDDRSIVKPVSVTLGKVSKAFILLVIGTWIAGKAGRVIQWVLTKRLTWAAANAEPIGKVIFGVLFVCVFVISLISVNIPLAVFTFLGGALAIGLGFGAQNIINNFISGMILLFDRSVKVGDIVEVDGQGGRVTAIGMRNSHIRRFDGIDLLVPNSKFLQEKVTNWTLSDRQIRYTVSVGVAYGSPTRVTERTIMAAIESHPIVLKDPAPTVLFEEFGDSSLIFTGYFWMELISNRDNRFAVSEIRHSISEALSKAGIEVSFPQRDVHLETARPLEVKVVMPEKKQ